MTTTLKLDIVLDASFSWCIAGYSARKRGIADKIGPVQVPHTGDI